MEHVSLTLQESLKLVFLYCLIVSGLLWISKSLIVSLFNASHEANELVYLFCNGVSLMFIFNGVTYITNALFNNLGTAQIATIMNFLKATVFTIPFVTAGAWCGGAEGVLWGLLLGTALAGIAGVWLAISLLRKLEASKVPS